METFAVEALPVTRRTNTMAFAIKAEVRDMAAKTFLRDRPFYEQL
jgi:hypothetical protein